MRSAPETLTVFTLVMMMDDLVYSRFVWTSWAACMIGLILVVCLNMIFLENLRVLSLLVTAMFFCVADFPGRLVEAVYVFPFNTQGQRISKLRGVRDMTNVWRSVFVFGVLYKLALVTLWLHMSDPPDTESICIIALFQAAVLIHAIIVVYTFRRLPKLHARLLACEHKTDDQGCASDLHTRVNGICFSSNPTPPSPLQFE